jgi:hypothetical protein
MHNATNAYTEFFASHISPFHDVAKLFRFVFVCEDKRDPWVAETEVFDFCLELDEPVCVCE